LAAAGMVAVGLLVAAAGALVPSEGWERILRGEASGRLGWGPALFRLLLVVHGAALAVVGIWLRRRAAAPGRRFRWPSALSLAALAPLVVLTLVAKNKNTKGQRK